MSWRKPVRREGDIRDKQISRFCIEFYQTYRCTGPSGHPLPAVLVVNSARATNPEGGLHFKVCAISTDLHAAAMVTAVLHLGPQILTSHVPDSKPDVQNKHHGVNTKHAKKVSSRARPISPSGRGVEGDSRSSVALCFLQANGWRCKLELGM